MIRQLSTSLLLVPLAAVLAACGQEADAPPPPITDEPMDARPMADTGRTGMTGMSAMAATFALQPSAGSGISGEATLSESGAGSEVLVRLTGSQPNVTHQGHIHQGTCQSPGQVVAPLEPVRTDGQGSGTSTSRVDVPLSAATNGQHIVAYHEAGGSPGAPVVCGEIPAAGM